MYERMPQEIAHYEEESEGQQTKQEDEQRR
jgi:hypothetical protein